MAATRHTRTRTSIAPQLAEPVWRGSKFRRDVGGLLVGGVDITMSSDPRTVVCMAYSPLLHYAFRVAELRGGHKDVSKLYRVVRLYHGIR